MIIKHVCQTFEAAKDPRIVPINFFQKSEVFLTILTCPNKSTSRILINLIPLFFYPHLQSYSPIRTRTPCWKGLFWGGQQEKRERTPDFHHPPTPFPQATPTDGPKLKKSLKSKPRAPRRFETLMRFKEVFTARQMNFECPLVKWCWIEIYKTYTHVI